MRARCIPRPLKRVTLVVTTHVVLAHVALAEPETVRIEYVAPATCPDASLFVRSVRQRTTQFRQTATDHHIRRFVVRVTGEAASFSGQLEIRDHDGSTAVRSVDAATCDEVSNALALMTALAIDPSALSSSPKAQAESPAKPAKEPAPESHRESHPPQPVPPATSPEPEKQASSQPWRWSAGVMGHSTFGLMEPARSGAAQSAGYGGDLFVDAEAPISAKLRSAFRAGLFFNHSNVELKGGPVASFDWVLVALEGCPVRLALIAQGVTVDPCLAIRAGVLRGEGRQISHPMQASNFWSDAGAVLRLRFSVSTRLVVEAQATVVLPLNRPTFEIVDIGAHATLGYEPRVGGSAGLGAAYRFR